MTAHERYQMFVGEIGIPRREYLYELKFSDIVLIQRGYASRSRGMWSATRWQTYRIMEAFVGSEGMIKANLNSPKDLMEFPWEKDAPPPLTDDEVKQIQEELAALNAQNE